MDEKQARIVSYGISVAVHVVILFLFSIYMLVKPETIIAEPEPVMLTWDNAIPTPHTQPAADAGQVEAKKDAATPKPPVKEKPIDPMPSKQPDKAVETQTPSETPKIEHTKPTAMPEPQPREQAEPKQDGELSAAPKLEAAVPKTSGPKKVLETTDQQRKTTPDQDAPESGAIKKSDDPAKNGPGKSAGDSDKDGSSPVKLARPGSGFPAPKDLEAIGYQPPDGRMTILVDVSETGKALACLKFTPEDYLDDNIKQVLCRGIDSPSVLIPAKDKAGKPVRRNADIILKFTDNGILIEKVSDAK